MNQRLPVVLSTTALVVAVFGSTPLGQAAAELAGKIPPLAKKANFATTAGTANDSKKLGGLPAASYARLGSDGKLPASIGAVGPQGPQGLKGDKGEKGDKGPQGANGVVAAFSIDGPGNSTPMATDAYRTVLHLDLPVGRYLIVARAHLGQGGQAQYSGFCKLAAGNRSDTLGVQGVKNPTVGGVGSASNVFLNVIQEFTAAGGADLQCWSPAVAPATWSSPKITAIAITPTAIAATSPSAISSP